VSIYFYPTMKNIAPILLTFTALSFGASAQNQDNEKSLGQLLADNTPTDNRVVVSYHVEERVFTASGSRVTTYDVSNLSQVSSTDLGPNNVRLITPRYGNAKPKARPTPVRAPKTPVAGNASPRVAEPPAVPAKSDLKPASVAPAGAMVMVKGTEPLSVSNVVVPAVIPMAAEVAAPKTVVVNIVDTYERILEKGYKSLDMLKKVANNRFYDGNLTAAAKWYDELFAMTTDLEPEYYFRYATSLKSVGKIEKANEMMAVFEKNK